MRMEFRTYLRGEFDHKFEKAQKKFAKLGQDLRVLSEATETRVEHREVCNCVGVGFAEEINYTIVEISEPEINVKPGVKFFGTISTADNTKMCYSAPDKPESLVLQEQELRCDCCKSNRRRKKYFFFEEDGELLCLGSTCVQPYFGFNVERILRLHERLICGLAEDMDELGSGGYSSGYYAYSLTELTLATEFVCADGFWRSTRQEHLGCPSSHEIRDMLKIDDKHSVDQAKRKKFDEFCRNADRDRGRQMAALLRELYLCPADDFTHNIYNALFIEDANGKPILRDMIPAKASGIACFAIFQAVHGKRDIEAREGEYVGKSGERLEIDVTVTDAREVPGYMGVNLMIAFETDAGNKLRWFYSGDYVLSEWVDRIEKQEKIRVRGTIKKHNQYKGEKQTVLTRVKVID